MKKLFCILFLSFSFAAYSQLITEEEILVKVKSSQENCIGAHESIVLRTNETLAKDLWGKSDRFNEAEIVKFFRHPAGEKVEGGFDVNMSAGKKWSFPYEVQPVADLLTENGVRVTESFNKLWINANQDLLYAESTKDGNKIILELYCPHQKFLEVLRMGQTQSIEFLLTGYYGSSAKNDKIYGVLTKVNAEKPYIKCSNEHEYDKATGYKFCPKCGEALK
jgi:hypothetical protein